LEQTRTPEKGPTESTVAPGHADGQTGLADHGSMPFLFAHVGAEGVDRGSRIEGTLRLQRKAGNRAVASLIRTTTARNGHRIVIQRDNEGAFNKWFGSIPGAEGSLKAWLANPVNAARDKGGVTNWGITFKTYQARAGAAGLPAGWDGFENMTPDQAKLIGRQFWRGSMADKVTKDGVAIAMADWYWGAPNDSLGDALRAVLNDYVKPAPGDADDGTVIELLNSFPDEATFLLALTGKRLEFHRSVVEKDSKQGVFLVGWITRAVEQAWVSLGAAGTVQLLERLEPKELEFFLAKRTKKEIADIHVAARENPDSKVAKATRYRFLVFKYKEAVTQGNWPEAAFFLNGFQRSDINELLIWAIMQKGNSAKTLLHEAATSTVGEGSQLATMTAPRAPKTPKKK
jgi:Glycosyl hydrolase 108